MRRKVFRGACLMIIDSDFHNDDDDVINAILSAFSDNGKMADEQSWLPMHFAVGLFVQKKISAEDVHTSHATDPLAMSRMSQNGQTGCTPAHLLCMQKNPDV
jgi:hypothetical protein